MELKWKDYNCKKCGHTWTSKKLAEAPLACPKCKRYDWNKKAQ